MTRSRRRGTCRLVVAIPACAWVLLTGSSAMVAQEPTTLATPKESAAQKPSTAELPVPADAHVEQSIEIAGHTLTYTVTVGTIPVRGTDGQTLADVVFTSYEVQGPHRSVTFAFNGGPGAASVFLNLGAIGPKHTVFGNQGDSASASAGLRDNPSTWLDFTDLVFIDPVGTGFSRTRASAEQTKKTFYTTENDVRYLARVVYDWLVMRQRLESRTYLAGESYGGYRVPRMARELQTEIGVAVSGFVVISPYLNPTITENGDISPLPWIVTLPSMAAAYLERQHKLTAAAMAPVIAYARGDYAADLLRGRSDPQALSRIIDHVTALTGLDRQFVQRSGGRIATTAYLREEDREHGKIGSLYDPNVTTFDPFPFAPDARGRDPMLESIIAPTTTAMVDFVTRVVGWHPTWAYQALNDAVARQWDRGQHRVTSRRGARPA